MNINDFVVKGLEKHKKVASIYLCLLFAKLHVMEGVTHLKGWGHFCPTEHSATKLSGKV